MITPSEIKEQCLKWWKDVLLSFIDNTSIFPKEINRIGKVNSKDILNKLSEYKQAIELLKNNSKDTKGRSYNLMTEERQFDKIGKQIVPIKISIDSLDDYLKLTGKEKEYQMFNKNHVLIVEQLPVLKEWIKQNPMKLIEHETWHDTLKVCQYFLANPKPNLYIRQLPIDIHTKYIEENKNIIKSLLIFLIPNSVNYEGETFEQMFSLKEKEKRIRIRFLDNKLSPLKGYSDLSFLLYELSQLNVDCKNVFVTENELNFLTLPFLPDTVAIWSGGGFQVSYLKNIEWLKDKQFFYWGDLDAQGFQILNQFRTYFPNTIAVMMDEETLSSFQATNGQQATNQNLQKLSDNELKLYHHLRQNNIRLEQEKITQKFAEERIKKLIG